RVATSDWCSITTKTRKISSCKTPAARSRSQSCSCYEVKGGSLLPRRITRALSQRQIPHSARGTAAAHLPRFRALALFGRQPPYRVDRLSPRRPKTCTKPAASSYSNSEDQRPSCAPLLGEVVFWVK